MEPLKLVIGNKNYSSWSLRPWILLRHFEIPFDEIFVPLYEGDYKSRLLALSPAGKVPALIHGDLVIGESLAIMEYAAELFPQKRMWPEDRKQRARARAFSHEMHSGFSELRKNMPMNLHGSYPGRGMTPAVKTDISRIERVWTECRKEFRSQGSFLFGSFSIVDAMYAPVVTRFVTYGVTLNEWSEAYIEAVRNMPAMKEWVAAGLAEKYRIAASEIYAE